MGERYNPEDELAKFRDDLPSLESLPGGAELSGLPDFPLSTHDGLTAAWSWINDPTNQDELEPGQIEHIRQRITELARQKGVDLGNA